MKSGVPRVPRCPGCPECQGCDCHECRTRARAASGNHPLQLQPGWRQPQRSSVMPFASLQCSEQYFPNSLSGGTVHEQPGWAHC